MMRPVTPRGVLAPPGWRLHIPVRSVPTYDYQCRSCGTITEVIHSMLEEGPTTCELCGNELRRVFHPTGIIFKGSGFYRTDSRSSGTGSEEPTQAKAPKEGATDTSSPSTKADTPSSGSADPSPSPSAAGE
jgi:putative FmdB family regulatory protein